MKARAALSFVLFGMLAAGCGGGGSAGIPAPTQAPLQPDELQVAVGTANVFGGGTGLNVVTTFRAPNGDSATLANTPALAGPSGFTVPATFPGAYGGVSSDAGTNHISGSPQVNLNVTPANTILGTFTGAFSYGFAPLNSDNTGAAYYPGSPNAAPGNGFTSSTYGLTGDGSYWQEPFVAAGSTVVQQDILGGPPAYPFFNDGSFPAGFAGYSQGFTAFQIPPATGAYSLNVAVTLVNAHSSTFSTTASIKSLTPLPLPVINSFTEDGKGGGTASVTIPSDPRTTETMLYVTDVNSSSGFNVYTFFTVGPVKGTGTETFTLPPFLGPCTGSGCENNAATQTPTITGPIAGSAPYTGDTYQVMAISYDYPAFEAGPPGNTSEAPPIAASNGQADIAMSQPWGGTYGTNSAAPLSSRMIKKNAPGNRRTRF